MKKYIILVLQAFLVVSCAKDIQEEPSYLEQNANRITSFYATIEGSESDSKVYADENMRVLWNADDRLTVFNKSTYNYQFRFTGDDGDNAGGFDEIPPAGLVSGNTLENIYAIYPYAAGNKINNSGNTITLNLPSEQPYKEHSFGIGANTMIAVTDNNFLAFKNVGGYLSVRLYGDNVSVSRVTLQGNNGEKLAGKATVAVGVGTLPAVTMTEDATETISIVCEPAVLLGTDSANYTDFWFVVPPTTFTNGFTITVTDELGGTFQKSTSKSFTVSRNTLEWMSALGVVPNYDNVSVVFTDANFKAYCVTNFDSNGDGEISFAEAANITNINVNTDNISSLGGIEHMPNLTSLICTGNGLNWGQLTSLDVTKNTALTYLRCEYNELPSLDVSNNTALQVLSCYYNELSSLDISNNTALTYLACYNNQLASLNIGNNTALDRLMCANNQLTSLDVSNNTSLNELTCYNNQLTSLDVSNNTALQYLYCNHNQLTTLDVSNNTALQTIECSNNFFSSIDVTNNTALTGLSCASNQLTSIDVTNNTALTKLSCQGNPLTSLDVSNNTALQTLNCISNNLTSLDVSNCTALTKLICWNNQLTSLNVNNCTALQRLECINNQLTSLDVSNNASMTYLDCRANSYLTEIWLRTGQTITTFNYDNNTATIKYKGIAFADANFKAYCVENFDTNGDGEISLAEAENITYISVDTDNIASLGGIEYMPNLSYLSCGGPSFQQIGQLTSLDVSHNTALERLFCHNNQLANLNVSNCAELQYLDCAYNQLASLDVSDCTALQNLNCLVNQLTSLDVSYFTALQYLDCGQNQLTSLDVTNNTALQQLRCAGNPLTRLDVTNNRDLLFLQCFDNELTSLDVSQNIALQVLSCSRNQLTSLDVTNNTSLQTLEFSNNQLTSLDVTNNTALQTLNCANNQLTALDLSNKTAFSELICWNNQLTSLNVNNCTALQRLECINNQLTSLDVSSCEALTKLHCWGNQLTSLDVSNNASMTYLDCRANSYLTEIWLRTGQTITTLQYNSDISTIKYKD